jgi:putative transposase
MGDLGDYFLSPYPFLLVLGAFRRILRRIRGIWLPRGKGRPPVGEDLIELVLDMKRANWRWGALRISQELALLGISLHKKTVQRLLRENGLLPPKTRITPPSWPAFLKPCAPIWALDFTCVFDAVGRQVFILAVIDLASRQLVAVNATLTPCRQWITQQICNAEMAGFRLPEALIADNDGIFGRWLEADFSAFFGIKVQRIPRGMPWLNGICERFHLSLKSEVLERIPPSEISVIRNFCFAFQDYYNEHRPHQGLIGATPIAQVDNLFKRDSKRPIRYRKISQVNGLVTRFELVAA